MDGLAFVVCFYFRRRRLDLSGWERGQRGKREAAVLQRTSLQNGTKCAVCGLSSERHIKSIKHMLTSDNGSAWMISNGVRGALMKLMGM